MSAESRPKLTVAQYLAIERQAEFKSEFYQGEMFAMGDAGRRPNAVKDNTLHTSRIHNTIKNNLIVDLDRGLSGSGCLTCSGDNRDVSRTGLYTYPDIVIVCGRPEYDPEDRDTLVNPQVIIEVLSPSTEGYDRGIKFTNYQRLGSLREYVLVSQDRIHIDRFVRQPDGTWNLTAFDDPEADFMLATVEARIPMRDIYAGVERLQATTKDQSAS